MAFMFFVSLSNITNVWLTTYRFFSFTQLNKRTTFLLRRLVWPSSFYIIENFMNYVFRFVKKNKVRFLDSFVSKKVHNKISRIRRYIWFIFSLFINKNAKIKTYIYNFSLMINNDPIITLYKNFSATPSITVGRQEIYTMT